MGGGLPAGGAIVPVADAARASMMRREAHRRIVNGAAGLPAGGALVPVVAAARASSAGACRAWP